MKIKFSHNYNKLSGVKNNKAVLIEVIPVKMENLHKPFLDYDTDNGKFYLPKLGIYLLLIFNSGGFIFTTIRRQTPEKKKYYDGCIGQEFDVEVVE